VGFLGLGRPKWRHQDAKVRLAAVQALESHQEKVAVEVALADGDAAVRAAAAHQVRSEGGLRRLLSAGDAIVVGSARERLAGVAFARVHEQTLAQCSDLLATINEQKSLAELSLSARDPAVREAAFARLCANGEPSPSLLAIIAIQDAAGGLAIRAVQAVDRRAQLKDIAKKAKRADVRSAAAQRLAALDAVEEKPSVESRRKTRSQALEPLAARLSQLAVASERREVGDDLAQVQQQWDGILADHGDLPEDETLIRLNQRLRQAQIVIARNRASAESAVRAEAERSAAASAALVTTGSSVAGAFSATASVEPPEPARVLSGEDEAALTAIASEAETLADAVDLRAADDGLRLLHKRWIALIAGVDDRHPLRLRFLDAHVRLKERRFAAREQRSADRAQRVTQLHVLIAEAERLAGDSAPAELMSHDEAVRRVQADWKAVGPVPPDIAAPLRTRFRAAIDQALVPLRQLREDEDWRRFAALSRSEELIAEVDALATFEDLPRLAGRLKAANAAWKELGPLPGAKREEQWTKFKTACDRQFERCRAFFTEQDAQRVVNLEQKKVLLVEVEALVGQGTIGLTGSPADVAQKRVTAERLKAIQAQWKEIGPVPREHDQELWGRFRGLCDQFFAGANALRGQEEADNLARKQALCADAEALASAVESITGAVTGDRQRWLRQVKELQAQWKEIGFVPREDKDTVWTRFKAACDRVYAPLREQFAALDQERAANLQRKQQIIAELELLAGRGDADAVRDDAQRLQRQWREIGHVPREQVDAVSARFRELCERLSGDRPEPAESGTADATAG